MRFGFPGFALGFALLVPLATAAPSMHDCDRLAAHPDDPSKLTGLAFIRGAKKFADFESAIDKALAELQ